MKLMEESRTQRKGFTLVETVIVALILFVLLALATPRYEASKTLANLSGARQGLQTLAAGAFAYKEVTETGGFLPPAGGAAQVGWMAWTDTANLPPNAPNNRFHSCSAIWEIGSFYATKGANSPQMAASPPPTTTHYDLRVMTSPIQVLSAFPRDPFKEGGTLPRSQYDYFGLDLAGEFVLRSLGPDGVAEVGCEFGGFNCGCAAAQCLQLGTDAPGRRTFDAGVDANFECSECNTLDQALRFGGVVYSPTNGIESRGDLFQSSSQGDPGFPQVANWNFF